MFHEEAKVIQCYLSCKRTGCSSTNNHLLDEKKVGEAKKRL